MRYIPLQNVNNRYIIKLSVIAGSQPLYFNKHGEPLERVGASCVKISRTQVKEKLEVLFPTIFMEWIQFMEQKEFMEQKKACSG